MRTYPNSFKAMDLVAEHRLRSLHKSAAWQARQQQPEALPHLGSMIEKLIRVIDRCLASMEEVISLMHILLSFCIIELQMC